MLHRAIAVHDPDRCLADRVVGGDVHEQSEPFHFERGGLLILQPADEQLERCLRRLELEPFRLQFLHLFQYRTTAILFGLDAQLLGLGQYR